MTDAEQKTDNVQPVNEAIAQKTQDAVLWYNIRQAAKKNPVLAEALSQVVTLYMMYK